MEQGVRSYLIHLPSAGLPLGMTLSDALHEEQTRASQMRPQLAERHIRHRLWLRHVLGTTLSLAAEDVRFRYTDKGKPELASNLRANHADQPLHFSLSHAGDMLAIATSWTGSVGIDIEPIRPFAGMNEVARFICHPAEYARYAPTLTDDSPPTTFFALWTAKESLLKALGQGLALAPSAFCLKDYETGAPRLRIAPILPYLPKPETTRLQLRSFAAPGKQCGENYILSQCICSGTHNQTFTASCCFGDVMPGAPPLPQGRALELSSTA